MKLIFQQVHAFFFLVYFYILVTECFFPTKQFSRTTALQTENHIDNVRSKREDSSLEDHSNPQFSLSCP